MNKVIKKKVNQDSQQESTELKSIIECENLTEGEVVLSEEAMVRISNEESVLRRENYPFLNLNGKVGVYELNGEELEEEIGVIMLKFRQSYFVFSPKKSDKWILYTEEFDGGGAKVKLFRNRKGEKTEEIDNNTVEELKKIYIFPTGKIIDGKPEMDILKMKQIIYSVILTKTRIPQIVKFVLKGTGLRELFNFYKEFAHGEHIFNYIVELGKKREKNENGEQYNVPVFKKGRLLEDKEHDAVRKAMLMIESDLPKAEGIEKVEYRGEKDNAEGAGNPDIGIDVDEIFGPEVPDETRTVETPMTKTQEKLQKQIEYAKNYK